MNGKFDNQQIQDLIHFYNKLDGHIRKSNMHKEGNSVLLTLIKQNSNQVSKLLADSVIDKNNFFTEDLESLEEMGYIRKAADLDGADDYVITATGIWQVEVSKDIIDINKLLKYFQDTKLSFKAGEKPLKDIEKIILLSMLSIRTFTKQTAMDLNDLRNCDYWKDIFDLASVFLFSTQRISRQTWEPPRHGNEHPVSYIMKRANDLPQKTKHIYVFMGANRYRLNIEGEGKEKKNLGTLFSTIFEKIETTAEYHQIHEFLCDVAYDQSKNVIGINDFINDEWDSILEEALRDVYLSF